MKKIVLTHILVFLALIAFSETQAQCPLDRKGNNVRSANTVKYTLTAANTRFFIKLDDPLTSAVYKTGDVVKFTVLENVFGTYSKTDGDPKGSELSEGELVVVIPQGAQGFGRVNYAQRRTPFYVKGKARIHVLPEFIRLNNGKCIAVEIPPPNNYSTAAPTNIKPCKYNPGYKKANENEKPPEVSEDSKVPNLVQCIIGRRPNVAFTSGVVSAVAAGALAAAVADDREAEVGGLTLLNGASTGAGISDLINGTNSEIPNTMIFEISLKNDEEGFMKIEAPKNAEPKKDDPKP